MEALRAQKLELKGTAAARSGRRQARPKGSAPSSIVTGNGSGRDGKRASAPTCTGPTCGAPTCNGRISTTPTCTGRICGGALLEAADSHRADLHAADLTHARLRDADLRGADLRHARGLSRAQVEEATTNGATLLPLGRRAR